VASAFRASVRSSGWLVSAILRYVGEVWLETLPRRRCGLLYRSSRTTKRSQEYHQAPFTTVFVAHMTLPDDDHDQPSNRGP